MIHETDSLISEVMNGEFISPFASLTLQNLNVPRDGSNKTGWLEISSVSAYLDDLGSDEVPNP